MNTTSTSTSRSCYYVTAGPPKALACSRVALLPCACPLCPRPIHFPLRISEERPDLLLTDSMAEDERPQPLSPPASIPNNFDSPPGSLSPTSKIKPRRKDKDKEAAASAKRRCVSTACIACRRRKSKVCLLPSSKGTRPSPETDTDLDRHGLV